MVEIYNKINKDFYVFDPDTELISVNGVIVPYNEYQPVYSRNGIEDGSIPPTFIGILDKKSNSIITLSGKVNKLSDDEDIRF